MSNNTQLEKKYGLFTATAMVIGTVIGSGVFFKAEKVLNATGGNLPLGIGAWIVGGCIMVICAYVFAILSTCHDSCGDILDFSEVTVGKRYSYFVGWFMATIYFPTLVAVLAWVSARYTCVLLGWDITGGACLSISAFYLIVVYTMNAMAPKLAGKFQISTTVIKLIPLFLMAVIGTIAGLSNGILVENFTSGAIAEVKGNPFMTALIATAFAYEGWICATTIKSELKDAKKNLPLALTFGTVFIVLTYVLYYIGLAGTIENSIMMESGENGARLAFTYIFQNVGGTLLFLFVIISCLGTLNGLTMACSRSFYALASRDMGPIPERLRLLDPVTTMPVSSCWFGILTTGFWFLFFYGSQLASPAWFGPFSYDCSELPIVTTYALYIPIFVQMIRKETSLGTVKRYVMPVLAIIASAFMVYAAYGSHGNFVWPYLAMFAAIMAFGALFMPRKK